ncbi:polymorphic outer membrane protein [Chlamydia felis Fe/C-56]|uniref:Polymorphic outer membrane protein n=3 Tax=Chlamydia felis TaxID=83556 RepID=Q253N4_CHLFF|nr:autotransporter outer membrane beta-barrel domain-containing protein [Chlamydia felis]BAE81504.1 polymorphic outer membrane protein [Chlamydia felis Fe/C-56]
MGSKITKYLTSISLTFALFGNLYADDEPQPPADQTTQEVKIKTDRKGDFVANILWQNTYATTSGMNASRISLESLCDTSVYFDLEGGALGLCLNQHNMEEKSGFHMDGSGYYAGISCGSPSLYKIGVKFVSQHTNAKAHLGHDEVATDYLSLGGFWEVHGFKGRLIVVGNYLYTHGFHNLNHTHRQLIGACHASFESQTVGSALSFYFPLKARTNNRLTVIPFFRYQAFASKQNDFKEKGARVRSFVTPDSLVDISVPFGLHNKLAFHGYFPSLWELEVSYKPTLLRQKHLVGSVLVADDGTWISSPTEVCYHAFSINLKNETQVFKHLHINFDYQCDASSSTCSHYILAGGKLVF